jgi:hypothetical protein
MSSALRVLGGLLVLMGGIWFLQGVNVLTVGDSFMIGDQQWSLYGGVAVALGAGLLWSARRVRRP